jgi:carboxymethylenebutenolidase
MKERFVEIQTPSGRMETFVTHPAQEAPFPPVIIYMDIWGVREELFEIARRVGTVGYYCLVPDFYYREGKVRHEWRDADNRMISLHALDEERRQRVIAPGRRLSNQMVVDDTGAILAFLAKGEPVRAGGVGAIGYCMGGRHVLCAAGRFPDSIRASASLHGTSLISDAPDSPHLLAKQFRGELYCGFAERDPYAPLPMVKQLDELLAPCPVRYRYAIHDGAEHGYALPNRDIFHPRAAARDWAMIFAMFRRQLPA